jgi:hypothetical protein
MAARFRPRTKHPLIYSVRRRQKRCHRTELAITLSTTKLPYGRIYNLSEAELRALKAYHQEDGSLRLCMDYQALNNASVKNRYLLPHGDCKLTAISSWFIWEDILDNWSGLVGSDIRFAGRTVGTY